jgi:hypothetical protein
MANPYSPRTTDELYAFWVGFKTFEPAARLGGTYARKPHFHSSVEDNLANWPSSYSIREAINRQAPRTVARAIDLTLSTTLMKRYTSRLRAAALADDPRLACVKEFYGTTNGTSVYGLTHTLPDSDWRGSTSDSSHLWHIHLSFFTPFVDDARALAGVLSVLKGQSLAAWLAETGQQPPTKPKPPTTPDDGDDWGRTLIMALPTVSDNTAPLGARKAVQSLLAARGYPPENTFDSRGRPDGNFGPGSKAALGRYQDAKGLEPDRQCGPKTWTKLIKG